MYSYSGIIYDRATLGFIYQGGGYNARVLYIPPLPLVDFTALDGISGHIVIIEKFRVHRTLPVDWQV